MRFGCTSILPNPRGLAKRRFPRGASRITLSTMLSLREVVERYNALAPSPGEPVALSAFHLPADETSRLFTTLDEDYHISRYLHFSCGTGERYTIDGEEATHVSIDPAISSLL
jgi:hypothetical protein